TRARTGALSRRRRFLIWALIVVASLLGFVAILTTWVNRQVLDTTAWKNANTRLVENTEVRSALATYLVNQLYANVDVEQAIAEKLPPNLKQVAAPLSAALRGPAENAAERILARPRVQQLWISSTAVAHEKLVNVLENKTGHGVTTGNGVVTVDVRSLVRELAANLGLSGRLVYKLLPDTG